MRSKLLRSLFFLILTLSGISATTEDLWYQAYDAGIAAVNAKNWPVVQEKMLQAKAAGPKPGNRVRAYGTKYYSFNPDYYLGLAYFHQKKNELALQVLSAAKSEGLLKPDSKEYAECIRMINELQKPQQAAPVAIAADPFRKIENAIRDGRLSEARNLIAALGKPDDLRAITLISQIQKVEGRYRNLVNDSKTISDLETTERMLKEAIRKDSQNALFSSLLTDARSKKRTLDVHRRDWIARAELSLASKDFLSAREHARKAQQFAGKDEQIEAFLQKLSEQERVAQQNSSPVNVPPVQEDSSVKRAILSFYSGDYANSIRLLEQSIQNNQKTAKIYFYLGCGLAASSFMAQGEESSRLLQRAKQQFLNVKKIDPNFSYNMKYISPRIVEIFRKAV
jgi:hypothetical protein